MRDMSDGLFKPTSFKGVFMLEVKDLIKVYKGKNGNDVRAIDGVSLTFAEKGMIFLLGKSGSGKSTLLNLCGGLDFPDSGEIIIKGRSSKDFSQADFDSYRNTFVGFVFQEYNILDEFSVESNIALALELQGRSKDRQAVKDILEKVELTDFAKRKPNTLSGGQKQRVAIARALVKNPEIILADEPTGALDSATGKQVLDTLKKLSEEKLVIIVSHDREFAEQYADRIIELKDGKVISDVTKEKVAAKQASGNVSFIGDDTVSVKDGAALTDEDLNKIKDFLTAKSGSVVIASGEKDVSAYKKVAKIGDDDSKETFFATAADSSHGTAYSDADSKLIRSKLPLKHAAKIGASGLKVKPFRLFFTILLSLIAFTMFGLFSTLTFYNEKTTVVTTYKQSGYDYMYMAKKYNSTTTYYSYGKQDGYFSTSYMTRFTPADLADAQNKYGAVYGAYNFSLDKYSLGSGFSLGNVKSLRSSYYSTDIKMFVEVTGDSTDFELLTDTDLGALGKSDVVISSYLFDSIKQAGLYNGYSPSSGYVTLENYSDIVGKTLALNDNYMSAIVPVTVRGVYKADPPEKYATIKEGTEPSDSALSSQYANLIASGMYGMALVSPDFYDAHSALTRNSSGYVDLTRFSLKDNLSLKYTDGQGQSELGSFSYVAPFSAFPINRESVVFFKDGQTTLGKNEVLINFNAFHMFASSQWYSVASQMYDEAYKKEYDKAIAVYKEQYADEVATYREEQYQQYLSWGYAPETAAQQADIDAKSYLENLAFNDDPEFYSKINTAAHAVSDEFRNKINSSISLIESGRYEQNGITFSATTDDINNAIAFLLQLSDTSSLTAKSLGIFERSGASAGVDGLTCVGFVHGGNFSMSMIYADDEVYSTILAEYAATDSAGSQNEEYYSVEETKFVESADAKYNYLVMPFPEDKALEALVNDENIVADDDSFFGLATPLSDQLAFVNDLISNLEKIFLWTGVAMALFAMLLLFNFISVSIANKKKEIGILRAVGARSVDVFKIFYSESLIITAICYLLAMAACFVICPVLNTQVAAAMGASIFVFGPLSWLIMLGIALATSLIATFLPVYAIAKKRPVESIRAL